MTLTRPLLALLLAALALFAPASSWAGKPVADDVPVTEEEAPPPPPTNTRPSGNNIAIAWCSRGCVMLAITVHVPVPGSHISPAYTVPV